MSTLNFVEFGRCHVVAQIIKTKFIVGSIGNVRGVVDPLLLRALARTWNNKSDIESEPTMNSSHPLRVTACQIVVHRDEVHAFARQAIEICRQGRDQGLTFTRFHFGNPAEVQCRPAHHLHVVVALPNDTLCTFANDGKSFDQKVVEGFTSLEPGTEFGSLATQCVVRQ